MNRNMALNKRIRYFLIGTLSISFMTGCTSYSDTDYSEVDYQGKIVEVNTDETMILVDDDNQGQIWVDVSALDKDTERLHSPLEVNVWVEKAIDGDDSIPEKATRIDVIK